MKYVADEWRRLSDRERAYWDEEARNDKVRYVREKAEYKGPWNIPKRRAKKHPLAPKRPMSAFLKYSQKRRTRVKQENPDMSNTDVSRLLGEMWRNASAADRAPYVEEEERERAQYKEDIAMWRQEQAKRDTARRTPHHPQPEASTVDPDLFEPLVMAPVRESIPEGIFRSQRYARPEDFREYYHPAERYVPPQPYYGHYYPAYYRGKMTCSRCCMSDETPVGSHERALFQRIRAPILPMAVHTTRVTIQVMVITRDPPRNISVERIENSFAAFWLFYFRYITVIYSLSLSSSLPDSAAPTLNDTEYS